MAENQASGPLMGQTVIYTSAGSTYPATVISVNPTNGLVRLTTMPPGGGTADQQNVPYDGRGLISGSWRYPDNITGI